MRQTETVMARRRRRPWTRLILAALDLTFRIVNRFAQWHRLPLEVLREANLLALRNRLRRENLHDTSVRITGRKPPADAPDLSYLYSRSPDGSHNDLRDPAMGRAGERFGRNAPPAHTFPARNLMEPSPALISRDLLARKQFKPATSLNLLAAAWIQFQVHDWFAHDTPAGSTPLRIPAPPDGPPGVGSFQIFPTREDPPRLNGAPPAFANLNSHWWDGSQIYGTEAAQALKLRSDSQGRLLADGRLTLGDDDMLRMEPDPANPERKLPVTGFRDNWWTGLELLHTLFAREHNAICTNLREEYPGWNDDQIYGTARLVNSALMAKIHTIEWTPAILATRTLEKGMNTNWSGLPRRSMFDKVARLIAGALGDEELLEGIPNSPADHHSAPYALTEEFAAVYRMHPLLPDEFRFLSLQDGKLLGTLGLMDVAFGNARRPLELGASMDDLIYSFGRSHPGAITLFNYPRALVNLTLPDGNRIDLAAVDIVRDRERGVPRYNSFRQMLRMPRIKSFRQMASGDVAVEETLRRIYGDVDDVDLMVGLFSEPPPEGFGFSDTAFRIFILMASRRLKSDRFLTDDFRPEIYTPLGIHWVQCNTLTTVLRRHYPSLAGAIHEGNAFKPWPAPTPAPPAGDGTAR